MSWYLNFMCEPWGECISNGRYEIKSARSFLALISFCLVNLATAHFFVEPVISIPCAVRGVSNITDSKSVRNVRASKHAPFAEWCKWNGNGTIYRSLQMFNWSLSMCIHCNVVWMVRARTKKKSNKSDIWCSFLVFAPSLSSPYSKHATNDSCLFIYIPITLA